MRRVASRESRSSVDSAEWMEAGRDVRMSNDAEREQLPRSSTRASRERVEIYVGTDDDTSTPDSLENDFFPRGYCNPYRYCYDPPRRSARGSPWGSPRASRESRDGGTSLKPGARKRPGRSRRMRRWQDLGAIAIFVIFLPWASLNMIDLMLGRRPGTTLASVIDDAPWRTRSDSTSSRPQQQHPAGGSAPAGAT